MAKNKYSLSIINAHLLEQYQSSIAEYPLAKHFQSLKDAQISNDTFSFYTSVASVFSSKIEGEEIELDSYIKHKGMGMVFQPDYTRKIDDLYDAYIFAQCNVLSEANLAKAHTLLSKNLVATSHQGKLRTNKMYIATDEGRIEYVAISPFALKKEMDKFYQDLAFLIAQALSIEEVFYYAAYIHLVFVKIHPWNDGNGRTARLLEKWFIAQHLGEKAWYLQSEKHYYLQHQSYYTNLRRLGIEYEQLDYSKALPFLLMLPSYLATHTPVLKE
jgi:Fic family protein